MTKELKSIIQSYRYDDGDASKLHKNISPNKQAGKNSRNLPDLRPSLKQNLKVLFIGFNPGVESSLTQHHYAHHSNLFWKLFNQSKLLYKLYNLEDIEPEHRVCKAIHDFQLIKYSIGFSDLCLRCTAKASELTTKEKLSNVPRLYKEISANQVQNVVFIGKGIWEIVIKYQCLKNGDSKFKLNKENFQWGEIKKDDSNDIRYSSLISSIYEQELGGLDCKIFVFPSTSGLVASMSFEEKLSLWKDMMSKLERS